MQRIKLKKAYTLIELLFVIAILAVLSAIGVSMLHRQAQTARVNRAALEMQQVLEAAMTYSGQNGNQWPEDNRDAPNCDLSTTKIDKFVDNYLPNANRISTFGSNYCWGRADTQASQSYRFWVAIVVPNRALALRMAARLPNAKVTADPTAAEQQLPDCNADDQCYVRAEVALPQSGDAGNGNYMAAGYCQPGSHLVMGQQGCQEDDSAEATAPNVFSYQVHTHCPLDNEQAYIVGSPNFYNTNGRNFLASVYSCKLQAEQSSLPMCCHDPGHCSMQVSSNVQLPTRCVSQGDKQFVCPLHFQSILNNYGNMSFLFVHGGRSVGSIGGSYITYCRSGTVTRRTVRL